jgi:hypothetical protein
MVMYGAVVRKSYSNPTVSASDAVQPLINGDRLREVINESTINLMTGCEGSFLPNDAITTLNMYSLA